MSEIGLCVDCEKVRTDGFEDGEWVCASCSNDRYFKELINGKRVEIKIRLKDYKPATLEKIKAVLIENKI